MRKPKLRELKEAVRALLFGPYTARELPDADPNYRGEGQFDEDKCVACGGCAQVCPANAIEVIDKRDAEPPVREIRRYHDRCVFCGACEQECLTQGGVHLTPEYDLACFDRDDCIVSIEKPLVLCEMCGAIIGTQAHLRWVAQQVGARRFANPTLALTLEPRPTLEPIPERDKSLPPDRSDILRVLCPTCRRVVILTEVWG